MGGHRAVTVVRWVVLASALGAVACQALLSAEGPPGAASAGDGGVASDGAPPGSDSSLGDATSDSDLPIAELSAEGPPGAASAGDGGVASDGAPPGSDSSLGDATSDSDLPIADAGVDGALLPDAHITVFTFSPAPAAADAAFVISNQGGSDGGPFLFGSLDDPSGSNPPALKAGATSIVGPIRHFAMLADVEMGDQAGVDNGGPAAWTSIVGVHDNGPTNFSVVVQSFNGGAQPTLRVEARFPKAKGSPCSLDWVSPPGWGRVGAYVRWGDGRVSVDLAVPTGGRHCDFDTVTEPNELNYEFGFLDNVNGVGTWSFGLERLEFAAE